MRRSVRLRVGLALSVLGGSVLGAGVQGSPAQPARMVRVPVGIEAPTCVLTGQDGRRLALRDLMGKAVLVAFVYTSCPDVCPLMFGAATAVQRRVQAEGRGDVVSVFVTTDPEVDTPEVLRAFATRRGADLPSTVLLTGSADELRAVWEAFGVKVRRLARGLVDHSPLTFLIDARGVIRYRYLGGILDTETIAADVRTVLANTTTKRGAHGAHGAR
ncbi:MAG: SCO family protein [Candidatus Rokubacteria bacterium]|nr:SCO family protein [Candidatus Rokubacteria bacterium]